MSAPTIPKGFAPIVKRYLRAQGIKNRNVLTGNDFSWDESVQVRFEDGSFAVFKFAFFLEDPARKLVAIFTEHCGYHVFSSVELEIELVRTAVRGSIFHD